MLIYEKLGYNKIQARLIQLLLRDDNNNHSQDIEKPYLIGGGEGKIEKEKFIYQNHKIVFQKFILGDQIHYSLNTLDKKSECLLIILSKNENKDMCANINQISMVESCPVVGKLKSGGGSLLLKIALAFIISIKKRYKIKIIQVKDNSEKSCKNKKIKLWLLNTLKDGLPWHIKYNFEPYDTERLKLDETNKTKIIANLRILSRTKTSILKEENIIDIDNKIEKIYEKYKNESIKDFFNELLKNNDNCVYLENNQENIIKNLFLFDISGISYYIDLNKLQYGSCN